MWLFLEACITVFVAITDVEDYIGLTTRRLVFTPTSTQPSANRRQCVTIPVIDDTLLEGRERFLVQIQSDPRMPDGVLIGQNSTASVTILDNDTPGMHLIICTATTSPRCGGSD